MHEREVDAAARKCLDAEIYTKKGQLEQAKACYSQAS